MSARELDRARHPRPRGFLAIAALASVALWVAVGSVSQADTPPIASNAITIQGFAFVPATLTVAAGSKVVWTNRDEEPHIVVSVDGGFKSSPALDTGDGYAVVFAKPGTYTYFCSIHPHMVGKVIVK